MGKKNKKEKKGQGKEKTQQKAEKNAKKRQKKELAEKGEDDIEQMIAEFKAQDKKRTQVIEEKCAPPSPRCNMSLTPHPDKDELLMFGGEYFTGNLMYMYNDLFVYNTRKNEWLKVSAPNSPPPRSSHQAVALRQGGGQLWLFGGEFASPSQSQFYHYKDLWVFHLKEKRWEKISAPGGPSSRSGHRMVHCKKQLIVFGGFHDNIRDYKYFNDAYAFNLDTYTWVQLTISGTPPAPRSGCIMTTAQDQTRVVVYGGYSKEKVKKEVDTGKVHTDMFALVPEGKVKEDTQPVKWKWVSVKQSGSRPTPRSGFSLAFAGNNRALCFGGVFDEEENEEQLQGKFYNSLYMLEVDKGKWYEVALKGKKAGGEKKKRRKKKIDAEDGAGSIDNDDIDDDEEEEEEEEEEMDDGRTDEKTNEMEIGADDLKKLAIDSNEVSLNDDSTNEPGASDDAKTDSPVTMETEESVFKLTIGEQTGGASADGMDCGPTVEPVDLFKPHPRMNTLLTIKNGVLYLYGGIFEDGDRQYTLSDMYSLDTNKMDEWNTIIKSELKDQVWEGSDSSSGEDSDDGDGAAKRRHSDTDDDDEDDDDDIDLDFSDAPERPASEAIKDYFERTKEYWLSKAQEYCDAEDMKLSAKKLEKLAKEMCQEAF